MTSIVKSGIAAVALTAAASAASADGKLALYHWFDYIPQELLETFTAETGIEVTMETYDSNEAMLANLKAGKMGSYDVAVPGDYMVSIMAAEGLLDTIRAGELSNMGNIAPEWADPDFDPGRKHSVPYQWGSTSFAVDTSVYGGNIHTTDILFDTPPELAGKVNMMDSQGDVMALAALHLGIDQCVSDPAMVAGLGAMLKEVSQNWASYDTENARNLLVSGKVDVSMSFHGDAAKARGEKSSLQYAFPAQGYLVWMDNIVLLKDAPNRANALTFMDFMLKPENIAAVTNYARYSAGVSGVEAYLDPELATLPEANPVPGSGEGVFVQACDPATQALYDQAWAELTK